MASGGQGLGAIEDPDVVQAEEPAFKDIHSIRVLAVDPPGETQQQFVEDLLQELAIGLAPPPFFDLVNTPSGPGVDRRVNVTKLPLIGGELTVRMHEPLAQEQDKLLLGVVRVHQRECHAMEG